MYTFEVVRFIVERDGPNGWEQLGSKYIHVGYMQAVFKTKNDACSYYGRHNPHMRTITKFNHYRSDWDTTTHLLYIVRENHSIVSTIPPFCASDAPIITMTENGMETHFIRQTRMNTDKSDADFYEIRKVNYIPPFGRSVFDEHMASVTSAISAAFIEASMNNEKKDEK